MYSIRMYGYFFEQYYGHDRVMRLPDHLEVKQGDLLWMDKNYVLVLGEDLSFPEQYTGQWKGPGDILERYPSLLDKPTMNMIHAMSYQRFSPYKKIVPLRLPKSLDYFLSKSISYGTRKKKNGAYSRKRPAKNIQSPQIRYTHPHIHWEPAIPGQHLILFPDTRTMEQLIVQKYPSITTRKDCRIVRQSPTKAQYAKHFTAVQQGKIHTIITTHGSMFLDYTQLSQVTQLRPHKRYYHNRQSPRYNTDRVAKKRADLHHARYQALEAVSELPVYHTDDLPPSI